MRRLALLSPFTPFVTRHSSFPSLPFAVLAGGLADFFFEADAEFAWGGEAAGVGDVADAFPGMAEEAFGEVESHVEQLLIGALAEVFFEEIFEVAAGGGAVAGEFVDVDGLVEVLFEPLQGAGHGGVGGVIEGRGFIAVDAGGGEAAAEAAGEVVLLEAAGEFLHGAAAEGFGIGEDAAEAAGAEFRENQVVVDPDDGKIGGDAESEAGGGGDEAFGVAVVGAENSGGAGQGGEKVLEGGVSLQAGAIMPPGRGLGFPGRAETLFAEVGKAEIAGAEVCGMGKAEAGKVRGGGGADGRVVGMDPADIRRQVAFAEAGGEEDHSGALAEKVFEMFGFEDGRDDPVHFGLVRVGKHFLRLMFEDLKAQAGVVAGFADGGFGHAAEIGDFFEAEKGQRVWRCGGGGHHGVTIPEMRRRKQDAFSKRG